MAAGAEATPRAVRQDGPRTLAVTWADGREDRFDVRALRLACPCAACVDEVTGRRRLDPARVPADVRPVRVTGVGNYALKVVWSDGHDTGIYAFDRLRRMGEEGAGS